MTGLALVLAVVGPFSSQTAAAQQVSAETVQQLRDELARLRGDQAATNGRIAAVEATLDRLAGGPAPVAAQLAVNVGSTPASPPAAAAGGVVALAAKAASRLQISGDVRLRYEANRSDADGRNRDRGVLRARLRSALAVTDHLTIGAQLSTGDPDDPNTADVTLSNWDDDLQVSLDQVYLRYTAGNLTVTGGKVPNPFRRTDLVWDGDVSPEGLSVAYRQPLGGGATIKASGLYFQIDEAARAADSSMIGGQVEIATAPGKTHFELAAGYYDYRLNSLLGGDSGDFRTNLLRSDGRYLSDFNLLDVVGSATFAGPGERWPIQVVGNYVHNFGAALDDDTGYGVDLFVGRTAKAGDLRFGYGYARAEVDSVLAAFSHDNLDIGTNYLLHSASIDYVPRPNLLLNLTWYHYRPLHAAYAGANDPHDWLDRLRLNFMASF